MGKHPPNVPPPRNSNNINKCYIEERRQSGLRCIASQRDTKRHQWGCRSRRPQLWGGGTLRKEGRGTGRPGREVNKVLLILAAACLFVLDSLTACSRVGQYSFGIKGLRRRPGLLAYNGSRVFPLVLTLCREPAKRTWYHTGNGNKVVVFKIIWYYH